MNVKSSSTLSEAGNSSTTRPYLSPEQTESFPLKAYSYKSSRCSCLEEGSGLRVIIICFFTFTVAVTVALAVQIHYGEYQVTPHGSVATDSKECSLVGTQILKEGGNAVDAAVASTLCMGVVQPHVTGLGGGGFMLVYDHRKRQVLDVIDFRETAPSAMDPDNFTVDIPQHGGLSVGVPGFLRGLAVAHQLYGKLPWKNVVMPSVKLGRLGFPMSSSLIPAMNNRLSREEVGKLEPFFTPMLNTHEQVIHLPRVANVLELIAHSGPDVFYNGSLSNEVLDAVNQANGLMTLGDLQHYQPIRRSALSSTFSNFTVMVPGAPSGGPLLLAILGVLDGYNLTHTDANTVDTIHRIAETIRLTAAYQAKLGDPDFSLSVSNITLQMMDKTELGQLRSEVDQPTAHSWSVPSVPEPVGSHVAVMDSNDVYISVVSGLNTWFGSKVVTDSGFLLNNALANFYPVVSMNNASANEMGPGKRPLSLATPAIIVKSREVCSRRMVVGAADATLLAQVVFNLLVFQGNITTSIESPRIRAGEQSTNITLEVNHKPKLSDDVIQMLEKLGYNHQNLLEPYTSSNIVEKKGDNLSSHSDSRGGGVASRF